MHELDQLEALRKLGTVTDQNLDLANIGEHARFDDVARPSKVGELTGERRLEVAAGHAEVREALELGFGHHRLRQHRSPRDLLRANYRDHALMMQSEQAEQRDPEDRHRDHHLEQGECARAAVKKLHCDIPVGITSPLTMATWPVSGENSSVMTSPEASSRCTTVAST